MPTEADIVEKLARQLEQQKFLNDLQSCRTSEDFRKLTEKYEAICNEQS